MNTVQLVGRLTKEIDLKFTGNGTAVGNFTLAVNRNFRNENGEQETDFINCVIWRKSAENLANFTRKGSQIGIEGRIQTRNYENQQGQRVYVTEVVVNQFHLLEPRSVTEQRPVSPKGNDKSTPQNGYQQNRQPNKPQQNDWNYTDFNAYEGKGNNDIDFSQEDLPF